MRVGSFKNRVWLVGDGFPFLPRRGTRRILDL